MQNSQVASGFAGPGSVVRPGFNVNMNGSSVGDSRSPLTGQMYTPTNKRR